MRHLRVFDRRRVCLLDLKSITDARVTNTGALLIENDPTDQAAANRWVLAPGYWAIAGEWHDDDPGEHTGMPGCHAEHDDQGEPAEETEPVPDHPFGPVTSMPVPVIPATGFLAGVVAEIRTTGGMPSAGIYPGGEESDAARVRKAMQIHCICDALRCPHILNPSTPGERTAARLRQKLMLSRPPAQAEPLMRCTHRAGHDVFSEPHIWIEGGWAYGPGLHHPECPRHPDVYNRPVSAREGQPTPAVLTPAAVTGELSASADLSPTARIALAERALTALAEVEQITEVFARHAEPEPAPELVRPFVTGEHPLVVTDMEAGNSGPGGLPELPQRGTFSETQRELWNVCAEYGPETYAKEIWCELAIGHDGTHLSTQGGDRIRW